MELSYGSKWIVPSKLNPLLDCYFDYIDNFSFEHIDSNVIIRLSAINQCAIWINGRFAFLSSYTDLPDCNYVDTVDITSLIQSGKNTIRIICFSNKKHNLNASSSGVIFDILCDNKSLLVSSQNTMSRVATEYHNNIDTLKFSYNAANLSSSSYSYSDTFSSKSSLLPRPLANTAVTNKIDSYVLSHGFFAYSPFTKSLGIKETIKKVFLSDEDYNIFSNNERKFKPLKKNSEPLICRLSDKNYSSSANGVYITFDLKKETIGLITIDISAHQGTEIYIMASDNLSGKVASSSSDFIGNYTCKQGRNKFTYFFESNAFRYITVYIEAFDFDIYYVGMREKAYPLHKKSDFITSDSLHNKIFKECSSKLYENTSQLYDNLFLCADAIEFLHSPTLLQGIYYTFDNYDLAKQALSISALSMNDDGFLQSKSLKGKLIPSLSLLWIIKWHEYVFYSGDIFFAREMWKLAENIIRSFWRNSKGHDMQAPFAEDIYLNYYDSTEGLQKGFPKALRDKNNIDNYDGILTILYILALEALIKNAKLIYSHSDDFKKSPRQYDNIDFVEKISWCEMLLSGARANFHETFWDNSTGAYCTYVVNGDKLFFCELMNSLAMYANLVPTKFKKRIADILSENDKCAPALIPISTNSVLIKFEVLLNYNYSYAEYVLNQIVDLWSKIFFEEKNANNNSGNLAPLLVYYKYVLGITPKLPGFSDYKFTPLKLKEIMPIKGKIPRYNKASLDILVDTDSFKIT